jgi:hypothetical protein
MALALNDRVQQTGTANTTVSFTLSGAVTGFQDFTVVGNGNTTYYAATDESGNWEVGEGTYSTTGPTLTRTTILSSSNSGNAVTFTGTVNVWVTYPSSKAVFEDASGNVSPLGTITSGTWQGSTIGVAYGGTGVTTSSGANSVVLRDANGNVTGVNNAIIGITFITSAGGTTNLVASSTQIQTVVGSANQTIRLPDATTIAVGQFYTISCASSGTVTVEDYAGGFIETITQGGASQVLCSSTATIAGTWGFRVFAASNVTWGNAALDYNGLITSATWQGDVVESAYGGTGLSTFAAANNALYSTSASALAAGTLPVAAGGTGVTTSTGSGNNVLSTSPTLVTPALGTPASGDLANCTFPTLNQNTTGTASNVTGTVAIANGGTGGTTAQAARNNIAGATTSGQYLRGNGTNVLMSAIQAGDVPTLNQNTTGSAATLTTGRTIAITGDLTYTSGSFNGSANVTGTGTLANSGVTAGTYGGNNSIPSFTVDAKGRLTAASTVTPSGTYAISISGSSASTTGNAASATVLQTARTIGGVSFNGSANINLPGVNTAGNQNTSGSSASCTGNAATATTLQTARNINGVSFNGSADITITAAATNVNTQLASLGVGTAASGTAGEIRATNNVTAFFSDDRLKTRHGKIVNALAKLHTLDGFYFTPNQVAQDLGYEPKQDVGVSAQAVQAILPEIVVPAPIDDKYLTVRYEKLVPLLIEAIKELKAEIDTLKKAKECR